MEQDRLEYSDIDFTGRGWDRGLRGIEFTDEAVWIAASDELFCYSPTFELIAAYRNPYLRHCHEICRKGQLLFRRRLALIRFWSFTLDPEFIWDFTCLKMVKNGWDKDLIPAPREATICQQLPYQYGDGKRRRGLFQRS